MNQSLVDPTHPSYKPYYDGVCVEIARFSPEEVSRILQTSRAAGTTLTGALVAAIKVAYLKELVKRGRATELFEIGLDVAATQRPRAAARVAKDTRLELARYYTDVERMDQQVATTLEAVETYLVPETIIFFTSDHGAQLPYGKWNNYESGVRVPMLVSWPGVAEPGKRSRALISFVDILPTLIEIGGGTPPETGYGSSQIDGRSFLSLIKGESVRHRDYVFSTNSSAAHHTYPLRSTCNDRFRYIRNVYPELHFTSQTDHNREAQSHNLWVSWVSNAKSDPNIARKVHEYHQRPVEELYDLKADPNEQRNLAADPEYVQTLRKLRAITDNWIRLSGDTLEMHGKPMRLLYPIKR